MDIRQIMAPPAGQSYTAFFLRERTETDKLMRRPQWYKETVELFAVVELNGETKILPCITDGDGPELVPLTAERVKEIEERHHCHYEALLPEESPFDNIATTADYLQDCIYADTDEAGDRRCYLRTENQWN